MTSALPFGAANSNPDQFTPRPSKEEQGVRGDSGKAPLPSPRLRSRALPRRVPMRFSASFYAPDNGALPSGSATSWAPLRRVSA
jgi:hypothetical protein